MFLTKKRISAALNFFNRVSVFDYIEADNMNLFM